MNIKYNFIKIGSMVWWKDPAGETYGYGKVVEIRLDDGEKITDDTVLLLDGVEFGEAEVFAREIIVPDTSIDDLWHLKSYKERGLWVEYKGDKIIPRTIYFCSDMRAWRDMEIGNGYAYYRFDNALRPVMTPDGKHYRNDNLANVSCDYDGVNLLNFYHG